MLDACLLPELSDLTAGLKSVFLETEFAGQGFNLEAEPNPYSSTFPSQIVTCRFDGGRELRLLCKFAAGRDEGDAGHRRGLRYEASVYRWVLQPLQATVPRFYGVHRADSENHMWIVMEYIDGIRSHSAESPEDTLVAACRWIGQFHADAEKLLSRVSLPFLVVHDRQYYLKWARRAAAAASHVQDRFPWLAGACRRFEALTPVLSDAPATVIHGEYYTDNVLMRDGAVCPVDWQSAAAAAGEIDLAVITSGDWPRELVRHCRLEYERVRWPEGAPKDFARRLACARVYWSTLFLGDNPDCGPCEGDYGFVMEMRDAAEELGLI